MEAVQYQELFNGLLAIVNILVGFLIKVVWDSVTAIKGQQTEFAKELAAVHILVAGEYVKREYFERKIDALFTKLDSIQEASENYKRKYE